MTTPESTRVAFICFHKDNNVGLYTIDDNCPAPYCYVGNVLVGESSEDAVKREVKKQTNVEASVLSPLTQTEEEIDFYDLFLVIVEEESTEENYTKVHVADALEMIQDKTITDPLTQILILSLGVIILAPRQ